MVLAAVFEMLDCGLFILGLGNVLGRTGARFALLIKYDLYYKGFLLI